LPVASEHPPELPVDPLGGGTQWRLRSQMLGLTQSFAALQLVLHVLPSQTYGEQSVLRPVGVVTVCWPSQLAPEMHLPVAASHVLPGAQSASLAQDVLQTRPPQV